MISKTFQAAAEGIGFQFTEKESADKSYLYGVYGGYLVTLTESGKQKTLFINYYLPDAGDDSVKLLEISEALKSAVEGVSVSDYSVQIDGLSCTAICSVGEFLQLLDRLIEMLEGKEVAGVTQCSCCGNRIGKRFPKKLLRGGKNYLLCEHCALDKLEEGNREEKEKKENTPSRPLAGILGGLVGGLIGLLAYALVYYFAAPLFSGSAFEIRYLLCLLGFGEAYLIYRGYTMQNKRVGTSAYVSVTVLSAVCVSLSQYVGTFVGYAKLQGFSLLQAVKLPSMWLVHLRSVIDTSISYEQSVLDLYDVAPLFYRLLGFSLLFALIGTIIFLLGLYEKGKVKADPCELETLRITPASAASQSNAENA